MNRKDVILKKLASLVEYLDELREKEPLSLDDYLASRVRGEEIYGRASR